MKVNDIRKKYLDFFVSKKHHLISSDSLVPQNDPTLLFSGAGMNQFKEYFLGLKKDMTRATSSQKCIRTGDLDEVGRTAFHHSFFEMLGNFSFGDYFKKEAIEWAWEFLTKELKISTDRLRVTVHNTDDEAYKIWKDEIGVREDWIYKMGDKSNFWPSNAPKDGPNGPCGPCSEIYYDQNPNSDDPGDVDDGTRFAEIWNLVFTQYDRQEGGKLAPLKNKNIDTGMGLERLACVLQGKASNYEVDLFEGILQSISSKLSVELTNENKRSFYVITDHIRGVVMAMADGVIPSNEGRGYVIRKLVRRAIWNAHQLVSPKKLEEPFLDKVVPSVVEAMNVGYPELKDVEKSIIASLENEEKRFLETLDTGLKILTEHLEKVGKKNTLSGEAVFELYDTYGFPEELTRSIAEKEGVALDQKRFQELMAEQRERAKKASKISDSIFSSTDLEEKLLALPETKFLGYDSLKAKAKIIFVDVQGSEGVIVLDQSPFYAESGGQVGDRGVIEGEAFKARVEDTQKKDKVFIHAVEVVEGQVESGVDVDAVVDASYRERTMRNHTATHLLHAALRDILGDQVRQLGSLVSSEKLRFDYSYAQALSPEQLQQIEDSVNQEILKNTQVTKVEKSIEDAKKEGAIAFFGEKYGDKVRVVTVPGYSKELCGGTHCEGTGQIGAFVITSDSSVASGTRRIEALTGEGALDYIRSNRQRISALCRELKTTPDQLLERVSKLKKTIKQLEKGGAQAGSSKIDPAQIIKDAKDAGSCRFVSHRGKEIPIGELRNLSDKLRSGNEKCVYLLASEEEEKIHLLLGMTHDLASTNLDLRPLMKEFSSMIGARGGGRKDLIQGGAVNQGQLSDKWSEMQDKSVSFLQQTAEVS